MAYRSSFCLLGRFLLDHHLERRRPSYLRFRKLPEGSVEDSRHHLDHEPLMDRDSLLHLTSSYCGLERPNWDCSFASSSSFMELVDPKHQGPYPVSLLFSAAATSRKPDD